MLQIKNVLGDTIVVEPFQPEERTKGGLIIPDTARESPNVGKVLFVGPGTVDEPIKDVEVGDIIPYNKYSGSEMEINGKKLVFLKVTDCLCTLKENS